MKRPFRFAIGVNGLFSEAWTVFVQRSDIYAVSSNAKGAMKVSLHASGVCQYAMLDDFFQKHSWKLPKHPQGRTMLRWKRLPTPKTGAIGALIISFSSFERWIDVGEPMPSGAITLIPPPPDNNFGVDVGFFYSWEDPAEHIHEFGPNETPLYKFELKSGEFVALFAQLRKLPPDFFEDRTIEPERRIISMGVDPADQEDARGVSVHSVIQDREGAATIFSMHNMRLRRIPK